MTHTDDGPEMPLPPIVPQTLRVLPGRYRIERHDEAPADLGPPPLATVNGPDGVTLIRSTSASDPGSWVAFFSGDQPHDLDLPGMLVSILAPLGAADISVFVASTYDADLVLVPGARLAEAIATLTAAGHRIVDAPR